MIDRSLIKPETGDGFDPVRENPTLRAALNAMRDQRTVVAAYYRKLVVQDLIRQAQAGVR